MIKFKELIKVSGDFEIVKVLVMIKICLGWVGLGRGWISSPAKGRSENQRFSDPSRDSALEVVRTFPFRSLYIEMCWGFRLC